ncbi:LPS assembly protein LptD [Venatoribacter cucullus]|uniref:LPS-assembly protein LptD n=1 Tax=Venatoribacter cucullus TaxID=2661630 RepID=A0A9X7UXV3_9GAMM|nr:LPS assembly protein LptD [Venatoribacter cucullus]
MTQFCQTFQRLTSFIAVCSGLLLWPLAAHAENLSTPPLSWYERDQLSAAEQQALPEFCRGAYRIPAITPLPGDLSEAEADQSTSDKDGNFELQGNVVLQQQDRIVRSQTARWFQSLNTGEFSGQVGVTTPELVLQGEQASLDQTAGRLHINQAEYSLPGRHIRGSADEIQSTNTGLMDMRNATFTFCEPGHNDWDIAATELHLDQNEGIGTAKHTRLRIARVPVLYLPYYRFPIGDQRMTGFLNPSVAITSKLQAEDIQIPFYWNIAPNYDATITPHYVREHGTVLESQFRHKTRWFGDGEFNYAYLEKDKTTEEKRWLVNYQQEGRFGSNWQHRWVYNNVSDDDYLNDMTPTSYVDRTTQLPRRGEILWNRNNWHFDITGETFQTIDPNIGLAARPYGRLPQLNLSYMPLTINQWQFQQRLQATRFSRKSNDIINDTEQTLSGFAALNGDRLLSDTSLAYPMEWPFGFVKPEIEYRYRSYNLRDADEALLARPDAPDLHASFGVPRYSLDAGLYFDRDLDLFGSDYQQTLEPRVFWVNSPYQENQHQIPNFDSAAITVTYASLFTGERFTGDDRLADLDQVSAGVTSRFIRGDGLEQFRASVGQIFYQTDRQVQLNGTTVPPADTRNTSSMLAEVEWTPDTHWSVYSILEWDPYDNYTKQSRYGLRFQHDNRMLNLASNTTKQFNASKDETEVLSDQIDIGAFWSLNDRWALIARALYDNRPYEESPKQPRSRILESLAGVEYQNCCWRVQFTYRESSLQENNPESEFTTRKRYGFLFSVQLKGLGNFGAGTDKLISESVTGYSRRQYHDY